MSESVNLPALGESVTEGTVTRWLKQVGDRVEVDEPLLEVSTDKVDTEVPSPVAGVIEEILVAEDETAEVGSPLVKIGEGDGGSGASEGSGEASDTDSAADSTAENGAEQQAQKDTAGESTEAAQIPAEAMSADESGSGAESGSGSSQGAGQSGGETKDVTLPALGESVTEGTVTRWLKQVGETVEVDEALLEVSTDKVDTEIPSPVAGTLQEIKVSEDETVEVGAVLAVVGSGAAATGSAAPEEPEPAAKPEQQEQPQQQASAAESTEPESTEPAAREPAKAPQDEKAQAEKETAEAKADTSQAEAAPSAAQSGGESTGADANYVTPLVRKLANQHDIDLSTVEGTGVGGRIRKQDVTAAAEKKKSEAAAPQAPSAPAAAAASGAVPEASAKLRGTVEKVPRIRQTIARRMRESLDVSAQLTQVIEVDVSKIAKLRGAAKDKFQEQNGVKLTYLPFFAKAVAEALKQHPKLNSSFDEEAKEVTYHDAEHLAIAVDTDRGLLVPVINDAGNLNLAGLANRISDVAARTRDNSIGPNELSGGTFTITNIGSAGALFDTPIINQPQVGILGTGTIVKRPVVVSDTNGDDTIAIRSMMYLSLTYDHRLVDGADAGRFLQTLKARLEEGAFEPDLGI
ncbi:2-oxoglutarate dehydrogenase, E2 component, dihydrolipoamide succinyltransferase [Arthrobacter castelli]|uniref:2-oxoglutarate dehydrogenase, E2 component, dihydrolipoamide succinyltransferase n=1 Tax=Arthrobacter castelli TaxID=271431 RepID=UPI000428E141|nr:2-oxoglutarate dehydrogenase, E2 component, dihydrolipoamide succinyltransferase [Arthrobacter castelli]